MKNVCTSRLAQPAQNATIQRWTLLDSFVDQPLGCLLDYFPGGLLPGQRLIRNGVGYVPIIGFEVLPSEVIEALCHSDTPPVLSTVFADTGELCLPMHWLQLVREPIADEVAA